MESMNISIKDEAYRYLKSLKTREKSFLDVILEFKKKEKKQDVMRFFGVLKDADIDWDEKEKRIKSFRDSVSRGMG